jgi:hypothetical protein
MTQIDSPIEEIFAAPKAVVAMIHVGALPGTPYSSLPVHALIARAVDEARVLADAGFDGLIVENMHDRPYLRNEVGPEITGAMTAVLDAVRQKVSLPLGVQLLAGANTEALAAAHAGGAAFIRAENFVFAHVADEGIMDRAEAGPLLRYRRHLDAEHIRVFADIKKKHAAHALTADVDLAETARAAAFCGADGVVVSGISTGQPVELNELREVSAAVELPVIVGSGLTPENLPEHWDWADVFIAGSYLKKDGQWHRPPDPDRVETFMRAVRGLR